MQFALTLYPLWSGSKVLYKATMVDFQLNWEGWLENATLFPSTTETDDCSLNFDDLLGNGKGFGDVELGLEETGLSGLDWLDEKVDFAILDEPKSLLSQPDDATMQMLDDAASFLMNIPDDNSSFLLPDTIKSEFTICDDSDYQESIPPTTPLEITLASSPIYESISEAGSPVSISCEVDESSYCLSPGSVSDVDTSAYHLTPDEVSAVDAPIYYLSPDNVSDIDAKEYYVTPDVGTSAYCPSPGQSSDVSVSVIICNSDDLNNEAEELVETIEDVAQSVKRRRYVRTTNKIPKVHVKNVFHPYAKRSNTKSERQERKKVQNKEAAARYRVKKRVEDEELAVEVDGLEEEQKKLKSKHDDLATEIKYLKSLMQEMFQKKGVL